MEISIVPSIPLMATTGAVGVIVGVVIAFVWLRTSARSANAASAEELLNYLVIVLQPALGGKFVPVMGIVNKVLEAADTVAGVMDETALNEEIQKHATDAGITLAAPDHAAVLLALKMALNLQGQHQLRTAMVRTMVVASSVASVSGGVSSAPCSV